MCFTLLPSESVLILIKVCYATDILNSLCLEFKLLNFCSFSVVHVKPSWPQYVGQYGPTVKHLCEKAGIEGHYTNHSLRVTTATRGLEKGLRRNMSWREPAIEM